MNVATLAVGAAVLAVLARAVRETVRNKGRCYGCSGDCSKCAMSKM